MQNDYVDTKLKPDYNPEWSALVAAGSSCPPPGGGFDRHYHDGAEYWLIFGGRALVQVGDDRFTVSKGDIVATPPGVEHDILAVDPNDHLEMFYLATAVEPGGQAGHLHKGDDFEHRIEDLNALEGNGWQTPVAGDGWQESPSSKGYAQDGQQSQDASQWQSDGQHGDVESQP